MILKIQRYEKNEHWWMLDGIRKISKADYTDSVEKHRLFETGNADICILDFLYRLEKEGNKEHTHTIVRLICRSADGNEFTVFFDTIAYLCNDLGQTIEKMVANYNEIIEPKPQSNIGT